MPKKIIKKKKEELSDLPKKEKKKEDKQLYYIIGTMAGLIIVFLVAHSIFQGLRTFEYQGLTFTKEKFGNIPLYYYYYYTNPSHATGSAIAENPRMINVYLRYDPRENDIPVTGEIEFPRGKFIYVTLNSTGLTECKYSTLALGGLSSFLNQNGFTLKAGVFDEEEAKSEGLDYITCEKHPDNPTILIQSGDETSIERKSVKTISSSGGKIIGESTEYTNCYVITVANCEILQATEKFIVQSLIDARARQFY